MEAMIYTNDAKFGGSFKDVLNLQFKNSQKITIATGYLGTESVENYRNSLVTASKAKDGRVRVLLGMVFHSGLREKQYEALKLLDDKLRRAKNGSGVFITMKEYHGKIYQFDDVAYIGSSNFSSYGMWKRLECNTVVSDDAQRKKLSDFTDYLFSRNWTKSFAEVDLLRKKPTSEDKRDIESYVFNGELPLFIEGSEFKLKLRVDEQPASSLNLFFDKGRKNKQGLYAPRPWYEVEITASSEEWKNPFYPKSKKNKERGKSRIGYFDAYICVCQKIYFVRMSVGSDNGKAIASSKESGGRETLGKILKGCLELKGF